MSADRGIKYHHKRLCTSAGSNCEGKDSKKAIESGSFVPGEEETDGTKGKSNPYICRHLEHWHSDSYIFKNQTSQHALLNTVKHRMCLNILIAAEGKCYTQKNVVDVQIDCCEDGNTGKSRTCNGGIRL